MSDKIETRTLVSLETLRHAAEQMAEHVGGSAPSADRLMVFQFLLTKFEADEALHRHLATALARVDELTQMQKEDRAAFDSWSERVLSDAAETRRLAARAHERLDIMVAGLSANVEQVGAVSEKADELGKRLTLELAERVRAEAEKADGETR